MSALRIFQVTLVLVLWYFLAGLVFSRWLGLWPEGFEREGFFLVAAAMPWALLTLDFQQPAHSVLGTAVRDVLFLLLVGLGIAANAAILNGLLTRLARAVALEHALRRNVAAAQRRLRQRGTRRPRWHG
jgi:hypothetical protein